MIFFTSDQHYGHANIIKYCARPFADVEDMNRGLVERHNATVAPTDTVWHLGDFCMSEKFLPILGQLHGTHHLVVGNHDSPDVGHKKRAGACHRYLEAGFASIQGSARIEGLLAWHDPGNWTPGEAPDLCGHVHEAWKTRNGMINVGVDVWDYRPMSIDVIRELRRTL